MATEKEVVYQVASKKYALTISDHILDSQYGQIGLTEVERKIERLPIFKRLHNVSQLGLVNWIFPCALHTRYTHSLGVMHVAGQMAQHINANVKRTFFDESDIQIVRLAGMLHDIGHYPMSHNIEQAYKTINGTDSRRLDNEATGKHLGVYVNCPDYLNPYKIKEGANTHREENAEKEEKSRNEEHFLQNHAGSKGFHHEAIGYKIITHNSCIQAAIRDNFVLLDDTEANCKVLNPKFAPADKTEVTETEINRIVALLLEAIGHMVIGNYSYNNDTQYPWIEKYSAMIQLIHSDLDADNLDYLLRDASFSGTSYGLMDMGQLMNSLTVCSIQMENQKFPKYIIGVKKKGVGSVDQFLTNKYLAYSQMTMSKYVSVLEAMLLHLAKAWLRKERDYNCENLLEMVSKPETNEKYLAFTDAYIIRKIYELEGVGGMLPLLEKIVSRLKNYSAFDLANTPSNEMICTGFTKEDIFKEMDNSEVFQKFAALCSEIGEINGASLREGDKESKLFAFRFEEYQITKQIPLNDFLCMFDLADMSPDRRFQLHYYRLANGIPVLDSQEQYIYAEDVNYSPKQKTIPPLVVDCSQAALAKVSGMRFVALREYQIAIYS